jgi:hypothetical protein
MGFFDYVYFRIFSWYLEKFGKGDAPEWTALFLVVFLIFVNVLTVVLVIEGLLGRLVMTERLADPIYGGTGYSVAVLIGYFYWCKEPKRSCLINRYKSESPSVRARRSIYFRLYVVLTILLPIIVALLIKQH